MKTVNLASVLAANKGLPSDKRVALYELWGIKPKAAELNTLEVFIDGIRQLDPYSPERVTRMMSACYFGFGIPQIGKEMDCLWIGNKTIVNVELKSQDVGEDAIKKQLVQNRQYLAPLNRDVASFTFDSSTGNSYAVDVNGNLCSVTLKDIGTSIYKVHQEKMYEDDIEALFPPERYLVSPFNATTAFMNGQYFLTNQQGEIKKKILDFVNDASSGNFSSLTGGPGTGKSLLLYDIARTLKKLGWKVWIGHAGTLNEGHTTLINNGWQISYTRDMMSYDQNNKSFVLKEADVYMIDEAQRCYNLTSIVNEINKTGKKCVFSYDAEQVMKDEEQKRNNAAYIESMTSGHTHVLTSNVRTNAAVYSFVKALFNKRDQASKDTKGHVEITYCQTRGEACIMLRLLLDKGYRVPQFTPKQYGREDYFGLFPDTEPSAHEVIGQEFDDVAGMLSENMNYDATGKLVSSSTYLYREDKMLYQILSRARRKIHLVIVNNPTMLERCTRLLNR